MRVPECSRPICARTGTPPGARLCGLPDLSWWAPTGSPPHGGASGAMRSRSRGVLRPGRMEGDEGGHGICARKLWAQNPTSQLVFPFSPRLRLRPFPSLGFPTCRAVVNSVLPAALGRELNGEPRAPRSVQAPGRPRTERRTRGRIARKVTRLASCGLNPFLPPPFAPSWPGARSQRPRTGASCAGTGVARPSSRSCTPRCPRSRSRAGRSPRDPAGSTRTSRCPPGPGSPSSCLVRCAPLPQCALEVRPKQGPRGQGERW